MITGTLPGACFAAGMTKILRASGIRIFDYSKFAAALRDRVRETAAALTTAAELTIEHIAPDRCSSAGLRMRRIRMAARDELVAAIAGRYAQGDRVERGRILDEFAAVTSRRGS
jgi:hypothetical protein